MGIVSEIGQFFNAQIESVIQSEPVLEPTPAPLFPQRIDVYTGDDIQLSHTDIVFGLDPNQTPYGRRGSPEHEEYCAELWFSYQFAYILSGAVGLLSLLGGGAALLVDDISISDMQLDNTVVGAAAAVFAVVAISAARTARKIQRDYDQFCRDTPPPPPGVEQEEEVTERERGRAPGNHPDWKQVTELEPAPEVGLIVGLATLAAMLGRSTVKTASAIASLFIAASPLTPYQEELHYKHNVPFAKDMVL